MILTHSIAAPKWLELGCNINKHVLNRIIDQKFKQPSEIQKEVLASYNKQKHQCLVKLTPVLQNLPTYSNIE